MQSFVVSEWPSAYAVGGATSPALSLPFGQGDPANAHVLSCTGTWKHYLDAPVSRTVRLLSASIRKLALTCLLCFALGAAVRRYAGTCSPPTLLACAQPAALRLSPSLSARGAFKSSTARITCIAASCTAATLHLWCNMVHAWCKVEGQVGPASGSSLARRMTSRGIFRCQRMCKPSLGVGDKASSS